MSVAQVPALPAAAEGSWQTRPSLHVQFSPNTHRPPEGMSPWGEGMAATRARPARMAGSRAMLSARMLDGRVR